ncbi:MAG: hypothetical protein RIC03_13450 [Cyclobacteriaceae bacterium]
MLQNPQNLGHYDDSDDILIGQNAKTNQINQSILRFELDRAMIIGNLYNEATIIHYTDEQGVACQLEEVVQAVTMRHLIFKGGKMLPISSITKIVL